MIGFAGPRVIRETTHQKTFRQASKLQNFSSIDGLIDLIVHRKQLRATLISLLNYLCAAA